MPSESSAQTDGEVQTHSLWRNKNFLLLISGQSISNFGSSLSGLAFILLVLTLTNSPAQAGFIVGLETLPFLFLALPAGVWIDRWDRKRVLILCDLGRALNLLSIPLAMEIGHLSPTQLYFNSLIEGTFATFFNIAILASLPRIVPRHRLTEASAVVNVVGGATSLAGPPIGTFLFDIAHAAPFLADAISYLISAFSMFWMKGAFQQQRPLEAKRNLLQDIVEGATFIWKQPILRFQGFAGCGLNIVTATIPLVVTLLAKHVHASNITLGIIFSIAEIGSIVGALLATRVHKRLGFGPVMIGMFWSMTILFPLYLLTPNPFVLGIITAGIFLVEPIGGIVNVSYRLALTPDKFQGRVNSVHRLLGMGIGQPLGIATAGVLLQYMGTTTTVLIYTGILLIVTLATLLYTPVRNAPRL